MDGWMDRQEWINGQGWIDGQTGMDRDGQIGLTGMDGYSHG